MPTGSGMLNRALQHLGEQYVHVSVPKNNPNWTGPWDCSEFMSWLVYQEARILYGCLDDTAPPVEAKAYTGAWQSDSGSIGTRISVDQAAGTEGGIVLRYPPAPGQMGHVAMCDGNGGTVEAKGTAYGVVQDTVQNRYWDTGVIIPGIIYDPPATFQWIAPTHLYWTGGVGMDPNVVIQIQQALAANGFDPGPVDGAFGPNTAAAVAAFQATNGLVVDGQVGVQTANALGVQI